MLAVWVGLLNGCGAARPTAGESAVGGQQPASNRAVPGNEVRAPRADLLDPEFPARVAEARQLSDERTAELSFHDDDEFARVAEAQANREGLSTTVADTPAFQLAFGFAVLARVSSPPYAKTQREQLLAFYDRRSHVVHVRSHPNIPGGTEALKLVVAHELGHSLQAQHFPPVDFQRISAEDERLARLALLEGDAMLTMLAYQSREHFVPLTRSLAATSERLGDIATFERASGITEGSERLSALTRTRLEFPYQSGLNFAGALYRAGGFELVDRAFSMPPVSSEQVLHPERYLEGDQPVEVAVPALPSGYQTVAEGTVGELLTRLALSSCMDPKRAIQAAEGWGGDAFRVVEKDGLAGLLWATTWDTAADARQFELGVRQLAKCWARAQLSAKSVFAGPARIERRGRHVAVERGIAPERAQRLAQGLLALPKRHEQRRPPFGKVRLRPPVKAPMLANARRVGSRIVAPKLGLSAEVPGGYSVELTNIVTLLRDAPSFSRIVVSVSGWVVNGDSLETVYSEYAKAVRAELSEPLVVERSLEVLSTPLGRASRRTWQVGNSDLRFQLLVIPMCRNTGSLLVALARQDATAAQEQSRWLQSLRALPDNERELCRVLDP